MKLKMLISMSGHRFAVAKGDVVEVPAPEAGRLVEAEYAEKAGKDDKVTATWGHAEEAPAPVVEAAVQPDPETAVVVAPETAVAATPEVRG